VCPTRLQVSSYNFYLLEVYLPVLIWEVIVLLNIKWARSNGQEDWEDYAMFTSFVVGNAIEATRCIRTGELLPLVAFIGIPLTSLIGFVL
jgi:hypothetical protein